ncbi:MAG: hypothetical protein WC503_04180 [Candidatus Shapirobacteria bacterium]
MSNRVWFTRTIKNGVVKIEGVLYRVCEQWRKYNGELDDLRYLFYRYKIGKELEPYIALWGSKKYARGLEEFGKGPNCVEGAYVWDTWFETYNKNETRP